VERGAYKDATLTGLLFGALWVSGSHGKTPRPAVREFSAAVPHRTWAIADVGGVLERPTEVERLP